MAKVWKCPRCSNKFQAQYMPSLRFPPICGNGHRPDRVQMELVEIHDDRHRDLIDQCIQEYRNYLRGRRVYPYAEEFPELSQTEIRNCFVAARAWKAHLTDS